MSTTLTAPAEPCRRPVRTDDGPEGSRRAKLSVRNVGRLLRGIPASLLAEAATHDPDWLAVPGLGLSDLDELAWLARTWGLQIHIDGASGYRPGSTARVMLYRSETPRSRLADRGEA